MDDSFVEKEFQERNLDKQTPDDNNDLDDNYDGDDNGDEAFPHFLPTGRTSVCSQGAPALYRPLSLCRPAPADRLSGG